VLLSGDGYHDIATANGGYGDNQAGYSILASQNNLPGNFSVTTNLIGTNRRPTAIVSADLHNSGYIKDLAFAGVLNSGGTYHPVVWTMKQDANNSFSEMPVPAGQNYSSNVSDNTTDIGTSNSSVSLVEGDFNKDNYIDLAVAFNTANNGGPSGVTILKNMNGTGFNKVQEIQIPVTDVPTAIAYGHVNHDLKQDLVLLLAGSNSVQVLLVQLQDTFCLRWSTCSKPK
jgi:hypothetical protein